MKETTVDREDAVETAEEVVDEVTEQEMVGDWYAVEVTRIEKENDSQIAVHMDVPYGCDKWTFDKPYNWEPSSNRFVELCESRGYSKYSFHELIGDEVLIKPNGDGYWSMATRTRAEQLERDQQRVPNSVLGMDNDQMLAAIGIVIMLTFAVALL